MFFESHKKSGGINLLAFFVFVAILLTTCKNAGKPLPTEVSQAPVLPMLPTATKTLPLSTATPKIIPKAPTPELRRCSAPGTIHEQLFSSIYAGDMFYRVYLPPCYGIDGRSYPTLYLLPGNIHTDSIWDDLGVDEVAEAGILAGIFPSLIIVMADGGWIANNTSGGSASYEEVVVSELIPLIEGSYCAWAAADGRAIGGLSRGGYWALEIAFRHPEQFISVGGHSAALYDIAAGPNLNPQQTGLTRDLGNLRIYLDIGKQDYLIPNVRQLHEDMETAAIPHTWVLNEGQHENDYWMAHIEEYLTWYTLPWPLARNSYPIC